LIFLLPAAALAAGFVLDLLFGDPQGFPHIARLTGRLILALEKVFFPQDSRDNAALFWGGFLFCFSVLFVCTGIPGLLLFWAYELHPAAGFVVETLFIYQFIAVKDLRVESMRVHERLKNGDVEGAKAALSMIVGRDTGGLDEAGISRAAVETVAENCSDGAASPLFYIALGGAAGGAFYKAANTLDSMVGYKNERYLYFGRAAALLDDALNFLPSRLCALCMIAASAPLGYDARGAARVWRRDRRKHASPNAAQTEAACAGALGIRLAGPAFYEGKREEKPFIGDDTRPVGPEDIVRANRLHYAASVMVFVLAMGVRLCCTAAIFTAARA
jgi:adenosylcobinamide-phosphate synthase